MTQLTVSRPEADERIRRQIEKGVEFRAAEIGSKRDLEHHNAAYFTWDEYNVELLKKLFRTEDEAQSYSASPGFFSLGERSSLEEKIAEFRDDVASRIRRLESVLERLELFDEPPSADTGSEGDTQEAIARQLLETLDSIRKKNYQDDKLIREAKTLNMRLSPTYMRMYGAIPEITTTFPAHIWWPRAIDAAEQALAYATAVALDPSHQVQPPIRPVSDRVFVVHGRDDGLKEAVARLIDRLGYKPVILHERPDRGQTIIEKFEREAPDAAFAVILLTPDDEGRLRVGSEDTKSSPRARQNVVWEFGYFTALIGRDHVAALVVADDQLERPTDIDGVLFIPVEDIADETWRVRLAREMKAAGLSIDLNLVA